MFPFVTFFNLLGDNSPGQREATQAEVDYLGRDQQAEIDYLGRDAQAETDYLNRDAAAEQAYYAAQSGDWFA